jgi:hypothetical protein
VLATFVSNNQDRDVRPSQDQPIASTAEQMASLVMPKWA